MFRKQDKFGDKLNILSIDWDYWYLSSAEFKDRKEDKYYECHCGHCNFDQKKTIRSKEMIKNSKYFKTVKNIKEEEIYEYCFNFKKLPILVTENHRDIVQIFIDNEFTENVKEINVFNLDEHDDSGHYPNYLYNGDSLYHNLSCGNWVNCLEKRLPSTLSFSYYYIFSRKEKNFRKLFSEEMDIIFLCRSAPYTVGKGDIPFVKFINKLEKLYKRKAFVYGKGSKEIKELLVQNRS